MTTPAIKAYLRTIASKGGKAGVGKCKARSTEQARANALAGWIKRRAKQQLKPHYENRQSI